MARINEGMAMRFKNKVSLIIYESDFTGNQWNEIITAWADSYGVDVPEGVDSVQLDVSGVQFFTG